MNRLPWLIHRLFGREQNRGFLFQSNRLRLLSGPERSIDGIMQRVVPVGHRRAELRPRRASGLNRALIQQLSRLAFCFLCGQQLNQNRSRSNRCLAVRLVDDQPHRRRRACHIRLLAQNVNCRTSKDARYRDDSAQRCRVVALIGETIAKTLPDQILDSGRSRQRQFLLLKSMSRREVHVSIQPPHHYVFRIENLHRQISENRRHAAQ